MTHSVRPLVAGNWKMNGVSADLGELAALKKALHSPLSAACDVLVCVPATLVHRAAQAMAEGSVSIGGQDCHAAQKGAHTGDISAEMLDDCGASHVIVGHSERRTDHGETDAVVHAKAEAVWRAGLVAIICIGETEAQRKAGETLDVLTAQLNGSVPRGATAKNTVVAYEPVWAIGTGLTPTVEDVAEAHAHMRANLADRFEDAARMRLLYGGSVKPSNAIELLAIANVNGALVGGASLKAGDFVGIIEAYQHI
ncbi:MAG: triose-phosphate isomerase [Brucellaceae bacterium]|nr:triose-phosphate isomerase [Brucellaceae bacterium]